VVVVRANATGYVGPEGSEMDVTAYEQAMLEATIMGRLVLAGFVSPNPETKAILDEDACRKMTEALRPHAGDYERMFVGPAVDVMRAYYEPLWTQRPTLPAMPPTLRLDIHVAPAAVLGEPNRLSDKFPGGYRDVAPHLAPHKVWIRWRWLEPGATQGLSLDGLVWIGEGESRLAWFPKPWLAFQKAN
jgi:hypothetical protein